MNWQPMGNAPKNGTWIIGWESPGKVHVMRWWTAGLCAEERWYDSDANPRAPLFWILYQSPFAKDVEEI